jgi:hypothetical protein
VWQAWKEVVGGIIAGLTLGALYWPTLLAGLRSGQGRSLPQWESLQHTLEGGMWLAGRALLRSPGQEWLAGTPAMFRFLSTGLTWLFALVCAAAIAYAAYLFIMRIVQRRAAAGADALISLSLLTLGLQFLIFGTCRIRNGEHYYNASWWAYGCVLWFALASLPALWARLAGLALSLCLATATLSFAILIHQTGGSRSLFYGPVLHEQIRVARLLATSPGPVVTDVGAIQAFPWRIAALTELLPRSEAPPRPVYLHYLSPSPRDAHLGVSPIPATRPAAPDAPST